MDEVPFAEARMRLRRVEEEVMASGDDDDAATGGEMAMGVACGAKLSDL